MALPAPKCLDVTDLKFKLQNKIQVFKSNAHPKNNCSLIAAASSYGLVFVGTTGAELRVLQLKGLTDDKILNDTVPLRTVNLPSEPYQIALSCDHNYLSVDVVANGITFIYVYYVPSFTSTNIVKLQEIRVSADENVRCSQIAWNPVISNMLSVCTGNGGLSVYTIKDQQGLEFHSLDKAEMAMCACWSPKGKQIVVGFSNGKLMQFKPDLKPARTIPCPAGIMEGSFNVIAVQWLSTYQFAASFLQNNEDATPALFIINAPKVGSPSYINYDDICYSSNGPRKGQIFLQHILPWNLLLVASANSMEVGVLGTNEGGEAPNWNQWITADEARAELPLTVDKQETYPVGFSLETGCTHQMVIAEVNYPVMPMIHILSTHGFLVSFNILNTTSSFVDICSPPKPFSDTSGLSLFNKIEFNQPPIAAPPPYAEVKQPATSSSDLSFAVPSGATSTPAIAKTKSFFSPSENKSPMNLFGAPSNTQAPAYGQVNTAIPPTFGKSITFGSGADSTKPLSFGGGVTPSFGAPSIGFAPAASVSSGFAAQPSIPATSQPSLLKSSLTQQPQQKVVEQSKALITVPPTYNPSQLKKSDSTSDVTRPTTTVSKLEVNDDNNAAIKIMISEEILKFEKELNDLINRSKSLNTNVGTKEDSVSMIKSLKELQDLSVQATESTDSLTSDVQTLRLGLIESFAMVTEAGSKTAIYNNPSPQQHQESHAMSQSCRRQLTCLQNMLSQNEAQLQTINKQIDAQWSSHQDAMKMNSRNRMHTPSLEVMYQTLSKQQEIVNRHKNKLNIIRSKLGFREQSKNDFVKETTVESLTDSLISMSIAEQVHADAKRLTENKLCILRDILRNRRIRTVQIKRPDRLELSSEVIIQRVNTMAKAKKKVVTVKEPPKLQHNVTQLKPTGATAGSKRTQEKAKETTINLIQPVPVVSKTVEIVPVAPTKPLNVPAFVAKPSSTSLFAPLSSASSGTSPFASTVTSTSSFSFGGPKSQMFGIDSIINVPKDKVEPVKATTGILNFGSTLKADKENIVAKETTTLFAPAKTVKESENQSKIVNTEVPIQKPSPLFGFGGSVSVSQALDFKLSDTTASSKPEPVKPFMSFGSSATTITSAAASSGYTAPNSKSTFSSPFPTTVLNLAKPKDPNVGVSKSESIVKTSDGDKNKENAGQSFFANNSNITITPIAKAPLSGITSLPQSADNTETTKSIFTPTTAPPTMSMFESSAGKGFSLPTSTTAITSSESSEAKPSIASIFGVSQESTTTITPAESSTVKPSMPSNFGAPKTAWAFSFGNAMANIENASKPEEGGAPKVEAPKFGSVAAAPTTSAAPITTAETAIVAATSTTTNTALASPFSFNSLSFNTPQLAATTTSASVTDTATNIFQSFNICSPSTTSAATSNPSTNIFGTSGSFTAPKTETSSIFGGSASVTSSPFGSSNPTKSSIFTTPPAETNVAETSNIFGSMPVPEPSVFGSQSPSVPFGSGTGIFGASATNPSAPSSFGGGLAQQTSSPFSNIAPSTQAPFGTPKTTASPFSGTTGIFASSNAQNATTGGSLFATSTFGSASAATGSIFNSPPNNNSGAFGAPPFGQPASPQSQGSIFGGGATAFGQSGGFSTPPSGNFIQNTGGSVAQSGFGSPQPASFGTTQNFGEPLFGGAPTFGGGAAFGSTNAFGSTKPSFGAFGQPAVNPLGSPTQQNTLFEQLGSSQSGIGFGNLSNAPVQKPAEYGGSSFSSWR